jgi:hypothetical protein
VIGMKNSNFITKYILLIFASVMMLAITVPMTDARAQTTADNLYDVSEYRNQGAAYSSWSLHHTAA